MSVQTNLGTPGHSASAVSINLHEQLRCLACAASGIEIWAQLLCKRRNVQLSFILQVSGVEPSGVCGSTERHSQQSLCHRMSTGVRIPAGKLLSIWGNLPRKLVLFLAAAQCPSSF